MKITKERARQELQISLHELNTILEDLLTDKLDLFQSHNGMTISLSKEENEDYDYLITKGNIYILKEEDEL